MSERECSILRSDPDRDAHSFGAPFGGIFETLCCAPDLVREVAADEIFQVVRAVFSEENFRSLLRHRYEERGEEPTRSLGDGYYL